MPIFAYAMNLLAVGQTIVSSLFLPIVFGAEAAAPPATPPDAEYVIVEVVEATYTFVDVDGILLLTVNDMQIADCLPTISTDATPSECSTTQAPAEGLTLFEDGSIRWHYAPLEIVIVACVLPDWGCSVSGDVNLWAASSATP